MNTVQATEKKSKKIQATPEEPSAKLRGRVEHVRDIVENVREQAEVAFRDKPYLVPVAAGALGLGIGVLLGSKITRFIIFTAVGGIDACVAALGHDDDRVRAHATHALGSAVKYMEDMQLALFTHPADVLGVFLRFLDHGGDIEGTWQFPGGFCLYIERTQVAAATCHPGICARYGWPTMRKGGPMAA